MSKPVRRILVVDLSLVFTMTWKAVEGSGRLDDASAQTVEKITKLRDGWDVCVIACDAVIPSKTTTWASAPSFRSTIDPPRPDPEDPNRRIGYKANREPRGAPYYEQLRRTRDRLKADGCHILTAPELCHDDPCPYCDPTGVEPTKPMTQDCSDCWGRGFVYGTKPSGYYAEADDVIGWLVEEYREAAEAAIGNGCDRSEWALRIVSSDLDLSQCIDDTLSVELLSMHAGKTYRSDDIIAKFGVPPTAVAHYKALAGDPSDNYFPFRGPVLESGRRGPGIGAESARTLLAAFGGNALAAVRACVRDPIPSEIKPNIIALIRRAGGRPEGAEKTVRIGLDLATLRTRLPTLNGAFDPILRGPGPVTRITIDADDGPPASRVQDARQLASDLAAQGVRMVASSHPTGQDQGAISAALQQLHSGTAGTPPGSGSKTPDAHPALAANATPAPPSAPTSPEGGAAKAALVDPVHTSPGRGPSHRAQAEAGGNAVSAAPRTSVGPSAPPVRSAGGAAADGGDGVRVLRSDGVVEPAGATRPTNGEPPAKRETAIVVPSGPNERFTLAPYGLEPTDMTSAWWFAKRICESRTFPKFGTPDAVLAVICMGRVRGFPAMVSLENAYMVGGQVAWRSAFIAGTAMASGAAAYLAIKETNENHALAVTKRIRGGIGEEQRLVFTIGEAEKMGYLAAPKDGKQESSWRKQPGVMLRWRAIVSLARMVYYDAVGGMYDPSEVRSDGSASAEEIGE